MSACACGCACVRVRESVCEGEICKNRYFCKQEMDRCCGFGDCWCACVRVSAWERVWARERDCVSVCVCAGGWMRVDLVWSNEAKICETRRRSLESKILRTQFQCINFCCLFLTRLRHANLNHWSMELFCFVLFVFAFYFKQKAFLKCL